MGLQGMFYFLLFTYLKNFWLCHSACGILFPQPGVELTAPAVEGGFLTSGTTREVPSMLSLVYVLPKRAQSMLSFKKKKLR